MLDLHEVCPAEIGALDLATVEAAASSLALRIGGPPDLEPLSDYLASSAARNCPAAGSLRALGEGGWWTQERLHAAGIVADPYCTACSPVASGYRSVGSLHHRFCVCPETRAARDSHKDQCILRQAQSATHHWRPLFQHGVPIASARLATPKLVARWCGGRAPAEAFAFTGECFTDGALKGGSPSGARRAGWAAVLVDSSGDIVHGLYGSCPDSFPTSLRAELWGVLKLLELALLPVKIWVDNKGVVDGWHRGRRWCTSAARPAADLWKKVWDRIDDLGEGGLVIAKCKGHASEGDVQAGRSTPFLRKGNDQADHYAGFGAIVAEHLSPTQSAREAYAEARRWYKWLAVLASGWPCDTEARDVKQVHELQAAPAQQTTTCIVDWRVHPDTPHRITVTSGRLTCEVCTRFAGAHTARTFRARFARPACKGAPQDPARTSAQVCRAARGSGGRLSAASPSAASEAPELEPELLAAEPARDAPVLEQPDRDGPLLRALSPSPLRSRQIIVGRQRSEAERLRSRSRLRRTLEWCDTLSRGCRSFAPPPAPSASPVDLADVSDAFGSASTAAGIAGVAGAEGAEPRCLLEEKRISICVAACLAACSAPVLPAPRAGGSALPQESPQGQEHLLMVSGAITWCHRCGAYGEARLRGLLRPCPGPLLGRGGRSTTLQRLRAGKHPLTLAPLSRARPLK